MLFYVGLEGFEEGVVGLDVFGVVLVAVRYSLVECSGVAFF